ncbi:hypothetical protein BE04_15065 [Sorangium cellulosum]|uniref:Peptidoglycan binding-like domain-containing protein n=1 Tax=Sorangium cellulosum TaxID=56 RepID=A0A150PWQ7_SORCE|nr:hypothetical protein BE04_15065 [Sorangium cellulosum]
MNRPADVAEAKARLAALGFSWLPLVDTTVDELTIQTIKLFQAIKNGTDRIDGPQGNDGRIDVGGSTHRWLAARNAPRWMRLPTGSRADGYVKIVDGDRHDFGTDWLAAAIAGAGAAYRTHLDSHPGAAVLTINDASLPRGGPTDDHGGHETGLMADILLPRLDGRAGGGVVWESPTYDRAAMRAILRAFADQDATGFVLFNDPTLVADGLCRSYAGHDDHAHLRIVPPALGEPA